jgi:hypothetical protein
LFLERPERREEQIAAVAVDDDGVHVGKSAGAIQAGQAARATRAAIKLRVLMLSRDFLRENAARLLEEYPERFAGTGIERFVELDRLRREAVTKLEEKRRRRNELAAAKGKPSPEALAR